MLIQKNQPSWNVYIGNGRFNISDKELQSAYLEASNSIIKSIQINFPNSGLDNSKIEIQFYIFGDEVGKWGNGIFKLKDKS